MRLVGARPNAVSQPREPLPGKTNYLIGRDPHRWARDLDTYGRVEYREAYKGIDIAWYGNQGQIEYDFLLKPGADPSLIRVRFDGASRLALESGGDLRIETSAGSMKLRVPEVYQQIAGARQRVASRYVLRADNEIAFALAPYDKSRPLVIDPTLSYGTYFGSGLSITAMATDRNGNVYIGGGASSGVPLVNSLQTGTLGNADLWLAKFNSTGTTLIYSTYIGGSAQDSIETQSSIVVDLAGEVIVGGQTFSTDFPQVNPQQSQGSAAGYCLPYALKLNAAGNALVYSTYLGGSPPDGGTGWAAATDAAGNAYIAGEADGAFFTTAGVYQTTYGGGWSDAFVVKLGPTGTVIYSTMLGGAGLDYATAIVADSKGNAYVAGNTSSTAFHHNPPGAVTTNAGGLDVFVAKLNSTGTQVDWLTLLGGSGDETPWALARDASTGELYVAGATASQNFPVTAGAYQTTANGPQQGFVASINPNGLSFGFVTYVGGGREDAIHALALTSGTSPGLVVGGSTTSSTGFPVSNAIQPGFTGLTTTLWASTDSGANWNPSDTGLPAEVVGLAPDPSSPGGMLAASGNWTGFYSDFEWFKTSSPFTAWTPSGLASLFLWYRATGAQIVSAPGVLYTAYPFSVGLNDGNSLTHSTAFLAFASSDDGGTWRPLATPPAASSDSLGGIAVNSTNANELVEISFEGDVFRSTDGGASFTQTSTLEGSYVTWGYPSAVASSPNGTIYVSACGLFVSPDFGTTWSSQWLGECIGDIAVSPSDPSVIYATNAYNSTTLNIYKSSDAGATWTQMTSPGIADAFGTSLVVAPSNSNILYASSGNQIAMSPDGGTTWSAPATLPSSIWAIGVSAANPADVYAGAGTSVADGFAAKLSTDGKTLLWSTFYTGDNGASVNAVAQGASGNAWIAGNSSPGLPLTHNAYSSNAYGGTAFLARIADSTAACSYTISPASVRAYGTQAVNVTVTAPSGCAWTAAPTASWITLPGGSSGTGSAVISAALAANQTTGTRSGSISVGGKSFSITQALSSCTYALGGSTSVPSSGGPVSITVTAPAHCPWTATSESPAVTVLSGASGSGNGTVSLSVAANNSEVWLYPTVQIGPVTATIPQADPCVYTLAPQSLSDAAASGIMTVTANLPGCAWTPRSDSSWLTVSTNGIGSGTFPYSVQQNTTGGSRIANVTLEGQVFPGQVFQVTQAP